MWPGKPQARKWYFSAQNLPRAPITLSCGHSPACDLWGPGLLTSPFSAPFQPLCHSHCSSRGLCRPTGMRDFPLGGPCFPERQEAGSSSESILEDRGIMVTRKMVRVGVWEIWEGWGCYGINLSFYWKVNTENTANSLPLEKIMKAHSMGCLYSL